MSTALSCVLVLPHSARLVVMSPVISSSCPTKLQWGVPLTPGSSVLEDRARLFICSRSLVTDLQGPFMSHKMGGVKGRTGKGNEISLDFCTKDTARVVSKSHTVH